MNLNLPAQIAPTAASSPNKPDQLKDFLSDWSSLNMNELAKQVLQTLYDQNRQSIDSADRFENLEMLRSYSRSIFDDLKKHFVNRTLPLPKKSREVINLNLSILQELVLGYETIAHASVNNIGSTIDNEILSISIFRALNYLSEILLRSSEIYQAAPENLWHDSHQLYLLAEHKNLIEVEVFDQEREQKTTIANSYKHLLLFALAHPNALRQNDCNQVFNELYSWSNLASILKETSKAAINRVFCMQVLEDTAPHYLNENDFSPDASIRLLNTDKLVSHVKSLIVEKNKQTKERIVSDDIPLATLKTLVNSWGKNTERRFSRVKRVEQVNVAIGLSNICHAIRESISVKNTPVYPEDKFFQSTSKLEDTLNGSDHEFLKSKARTQKTEQNLMLEPIANDKREKGYITIGANEDNEWGMVARGRVLTDAYDKQSQLIDKDLINRQRQKPEIHWQVVNISAGGYCLRWKSSDTSIAQIGDLMALQKFSADDKFTWHVGVIRWMQYTKENGLGIGVQILSPKVEIATVQRANRLNETPLDCIMLPEINAIKQQASTILPAHTFDTGNKVLIKTQSNDILISLGGNQENTGAFTQYNYICNELR